VEVRDRKAGCGAGKGWDRHNAADPPTNTGRARRNPLKNDGKSDKGQLDNPRVRGRSTFRVNDLARAVKAAKMAGAERVEVDPSGRIIVFLAGPDPAPPETGRKNPWDI
jgi:hypothetical protein